MDEVIVYFPPNLNIGSFEFYRRYTVPCTSIFECMIEEDHLAETGRNIKINFKEIGCGDCTRYSSQLSSVSTGIWIWKLACYSENT